jgi:hypothetical protein
MYNLKIMNTENGTECSVTKGNKEAILKSLKSFLGNLEIETSSNRSTSKIKKLVG